VYFTSGDGDGPLAVVDVGVVSAADEREIRDCGGAAVDPGDQVVCVAHDRWGSADYAAAVAGVQCATHSAGDEAFAASDVERLGVGSEDQRDDLGVTGQAADGGSG
jgi:hypothetical protein